MTILRLSHIGLCVRDLDAALRFYRDVFGFEEVSRVEARGRVAETLMQLPGVDVLAVYLERDGTRIELLHYRAPAALEQPLRALNLAGLTHLSFRVTDLDATVEKALAAGGSCLTATRVERPGSKSIFIVDPDGTRVELLEIPLDKDWLPGMPVSR